MATKCPPARDADALLKTAPPELQVAGRALWDLTARNLVKAGRLRYGDLVGLRTMCQTEDIKDQAYASLSDLGVTIVTETVHGSTRAVPNPAASVYAKADTSLRQWYRAYCTGKRDEPVGL